MRKIENRVQMQLRINEELHAKLKVIAELEHRYLNGQIEYFLAQCVKEYEQENAPIKIPDSN